MFLTCLELLDVCANASANVSNDAASLVDTYSTHVAALYDCARTKVCHNGSVLPASTHITVEVAESNNTALVYAKCTLISGFD